MLRKSTAFAPRYQKLRAVSVADVCEELARGRRIDQVLAREVAGDPAHPDGKFGDLDPVPSLPLSEPNASA